MWKTGRHAQTQLASDTWRILWGKSNLYVSDLLKIGKYFYFIFRSQVNIFPGLWYRFLLNADYINKLTNDFCCLPEVYVTNVRNDCVVN